MSDSFKYEITEHIATLSENGETTKELNKVSYNGAEPKYDIRSWKRADGEERLLKGITLTEDEMNVLKETLSKL